MDNLMTPSCVAQSAAVWLPVELWQLAKVNNNAHRNIEHTAVSISTTTSLPLSRNNSMHVFTIF